MSIRRNLIWFCAAPLVVVGCLLLLVMNPGRGGAYVTLGYLFGTTFAYATLASAWTAFGPLPLVWRLPLALAWMIVMVIALVCNIGIFGGPGEVPVIMAGCLFGQFLLLQVPFWGLAIGFGQRLRRYEASDPVPDRSELQFGIRQLMIFTTIVAVLLGLGRLAVRVAPLVIPSLGGETPIFIFLAVAAIVTTLPLVLAALLPRLAIPAVTIVIVLIGLATICEVPVLSQFHKGAGPDTFHIIWINAFTATWLLVVLVIVRVSGYRLTRYRDQPGSPFRAGS